MIQNIITPVLAMAALGLVFGLGLAYALKIFGVEVDPALVKIISLLPGGNCGACGKAGCAVFAEALRRGEVLPTACVVSSEKTRQSVAEILGVEYNPRVKTIAIMRCNGGKRCRDKYVYQGIKSCKAATLVFGGQKECAFGCLGFGDCVEACRFGALTMDEDDLPQVNPERCTGCGKCVKACPKNLFILTPIECKFYVKCNSTDKGAAKMKFCKSSCIACFKCEKACPVGAARVESNLARIDPKKCENIGKCFEVCPTKVIIKRI